MKALMSQRTPQHCRLVHRKSSAMLSKGDAGPAESKALLETFWEDLCKLIRQRAMANHCCILPCS